MLVMLRRPGEAILIQGDIEIHILSVGRSRVRIGIKAPREISVVAREIELIQLENRAAAGCAPADALPLAIAGILRQARHGVRARNADKQSGGPSSHG